MLSMTGYGYSSDEGEDYFLELEIKGYNNRYLDIQHNFSAAFSAYEQRSDEKIREVCSRGRVEVIARLVRTKNDLEVSLDEDLLSKYLEAFKKAETLTGTSLTLTASDLLRVDSLIATVAKTGSEKYEKAFFDCLEKALIQFKEAKRREGEETKRDLVRLGNELVSSNAKILSEATQLEEYCKNALLKKYKELLADEKIDNSLMVQEIGTLLVKYSINEEQNRIKTHLSEYFRLLELDEPVGKRLDFLCQELNREVNTTASKSQLVEINLETVKMKDSIENIREQIRNIE